MSKYEVQGGDGPMLTPSGKNTVSEAEKSKIDKRQAKRYLTQGEAEKWKGGARWN